ncbi:MAG TPA: SDR family NAD(P)-dependent oxidoreductase [Acidimicrobiia bacterium]|nr:SDR family NAD(P)-dependent oxidoreductase [Acidimicrobiia bacterium]
MPLLEDKVAVVTGAARGIGRGHARLLAREGARVVVNDLDADEVAAVVADITALGGRAVANTDSVAAWSGGAALVQQAVDAFGRLDILVNNAGILRDAMSFNITEEQWDSVIDVHLKGHMSTSRAAAQHWRDRAKAGEAVTGRIINTTSESGLFGQAGQINYSAAKAGIVSMTIVLARELKKYGVTVNAVCPRARTRMTESMPGADEYMQGPVWDPENIAPLVCFLASDDAADISGQVFVIWGTKIHLMQGWQRVNSVDRGEGRWTAEELIARKDEIFAGHRRKIPPMGFGE